MDTHETIADIRKDAETKFRGLVEAYMQRRAAFQTTVGAMQAFNNVFDRLEAAIKRERAKIEADALEVGGIVEAERKRERGDAAKLREALETLMIDFDSNYADDDDIASWCDVNVETVRKARAALAAPPRNCDVGTAQEQDERFHRFCVKHHTGSCAGCHNPVGDYTVANGVRECALVWAQMPYEEGGAK